MKLPKVNTAKIWDALNFGIGITLGYILVQGGIRLADRYTGGTYIPDEFSSRVTYNDTNSYYASDTNNTLKYE